MDPLLWTVAAVVVLAGLAWASVRLRRKHVDRHNLTTPSSPAHNPVDRHVTARGGRA